MTISHGVPILPGEAVGRLLRFDQPISFWGGVDPRSGRVSDPRHPQYGESIAGRVIALPGTIGSSSSSYIMLELLATRHAPAAVLVPDVESILSLGVVVARELGYPSIPVLQVAVEAQRALPAGCRLLIAHDGAIQVED